ncbi:MAG TPA: DUF6644 family protein [Sphingobium sp.]|nr:DUF6644 family protein [Sphingobium sp.]
MIDTLLDAIGDSAVGMFVAENATAFPWIEVIHVLGIVVVFGSILLVDLRLMGLAARDYPALTFSRTILPVTWTAFIVAVVTGALMFASNPHGYFGNTMFRVKMLLLLAAGLNMLVFHLITMRGGRMTDGPGPLPGGARMAGLFSLTLWLAIIACGRWIGFTMAPF